MYTSPGLSCEWVVRVKRMSGSRRHAVDLSGTHWSQVEAAIASPGELQQRALGSLVEKYRPVLVAHLVGDWHFDRSTAEDLVAEFVLRKVLERNVLAQFDPEKLRLRSYLKVILERFVIDQLRAKTIDGYRACHLSDLPESIDRASSAGDAMDIEWARQIIQCAIEQFERECQRADRADLWLVFRGRLVDPLLHNKPAIRFEELVERLQLQSASRAHNLLVTAKRAYSRILQAIVAEYELGPEAIEREIQELFEIFSSARRTADRKT